MSSRDGESTFPAPIEVRPARPSDRDFFHELRKAALGPYVEEIWGWNEADQRARSDLVFERYPVEIVEEKGLAIGCLSVVHEDDQDLLELVALLPESQSQGIGSALIAAVQEEAAERGVPLRLSVLANNPARALYERLGFRVVRVEQPRVFMEWRP
jgi:ribosomal protein S18 acetylase RimI-like enzyme